MADHEAFNALLRSEHAEARQEPPDPEVQAGRAKVKDTLKVEAEAGDKGALATLHAMQVADGERRPPASADGGAGRDAPRPGPSSSELFGEEIREALWRKRARRQGSGGFRDRFIRHGVEGGS